MPMPFFSQAFNLYTDGSVAHAEFPEVAIAAGAPYQLLPSRTKLSLTAQAPPYAPQSVISGEATGLELTFLGI
jgi:hypothetical protein